MHCRRGSAVILYAVLSFVAYAASAAPAAATFPGRNGRLVVDLLFNGGTGKIHLMRPDGSDSRQVSKGDGVDLGASISHDGKKIAFYRVRDFTNLGIFVVNSDGTNQRRVPGTGSFDYFPTFAPDGRTLLFERDTQIYKLRLDGTHGGYVTGGKDENRYPVFSPDGKRIAFTRVDSATHREQAYTMHTDGTHLKRLLRNGSPTDFSPDGRKLALTRNGHIFVMTLRTGKLKRLTNTIYRDQDAVFSPNGRMIVFNRHESFDEDVSQNGVYRMRSDGTQLREILERPSKSLDWQPLPR
jgi:TolB protein